MEHTMIRNDSVRTPLDHQSSFRAILVLFFTWGFLTCLNDTLLPQLKFIFNLSYVHAVAVPVTFFSTCFFVAVPAAQLVRSVGYKRTIVVSLAVMACGAGAILLAANLERFWCFLIALSILGAGITALQVAAGPYVAALGPAAESPSRFSLALGFNSLGTMIAPLFGSWLIIQKSPDDASAASLPESVQVARQAAIHHLRAPYLLIALSLALLALLIATSRLPAMGDQPPGLSSVALKKVLGHRPLVFGAMASFLYAGAEVGIGSLLISYLSLASTGGFTRHVAAQFVAIYWGGATLGRLVGWGVLRRYRPELVLAACGASAAALLLTSVGSTGLLATVAILSVGLCNAMVVPVIFMLSIAGLGDETPHASSVMVASNIGAGLMPLAIGALADRVGLHRAFLLPVLSYGFVVFYALRGSRGHLLPRDNVSTSR